MKLSKCADAVKDFLRQPPAAACHYFENAGNPGAYYTASHDEILSRPFPYFSLCIFSPYTGC
jgi:precorrin-2/cobalt-factor-2 C20-methyltransferase